MKTKFEEYLDKPETRRNALLIIAAMFIIDLLLAGIFVYLATHRQ